MSECPPFVEVDMKLVTELFSSYNTATVWRWNTAKAGKNPLPAYDREFGGTKVWRLDTIVEWANRTGRRMDDAVLSKILECQS